MAYVANIKLKKNSPHATLTGDINDSVTTIPVSELEYFHDEDDTLITQGIVIGYDNTTETYPEEITITGASATSGAGNLTGATRGVNADGTNGAARSWSTGDKIAVMLSTGVYNRIKDNLAAHESDKIANSIMDAKGDILTATADNTPARLAVGTNGYVLTADSGESTGIKWAAAPGGGGASRWTALTITTDFDDDPPSTSTITMNSDQTGNIPVGSPIKFTLGGGASNPGTYYAIVTALTSNLMTIAGAPLETDDGDLTALSYGTPEMVEQMDIVVNGYYEDANNSALVASDVGAYLKWNKPKAYAVMYKAISKIADGSTDGKVTVLINAADLNSSAGGLTIAGSATWYSTVVDIATANYDINYGEMIELSVTKGTGGDARDLTVSIVFVYP